MRLSFFAVLPLLLVAATGAKAQTAPLAPALTVEDAVRLAVQNNPRMSAARQDSEAALSGVRSARALVNPNALAAPGLTSISGSGDEFLLQQPLELNGTRSARTGIAKAQLRATIAQAAVTVQDVVFRARSAYYELARAREQASITRDAVAVAREFDRVARRQVEEGARPGIDLAQTSLEVARAERDVTLADAEIIRALAELNTVMGRDPTLPIEAVTLLMTKSQQPPQSQSGATAPSAAESRTAGIVGTAQLLSRSLIARAELQSARATGDQLREEARLARAEGRPDLVPQFRVGSFTRGLPPARSGNGVGIGLAITLPLLDYGSRRNRIRQAEQAASAQDARLFALQNDVKREVVRGLARQTAAESVVKAYQSGVLNQAERLLSASRIGFREGRTSVVSLLEAQRSFRTVQSDYVNALADAAIARAELERATGAASPTLLPPSTH